MFPLGLNAMLMLTVTQRSIFLLVWHFKTKLQARIFSISLGQCLSEFCWFLTPWRFKRCSYSFHRLFPHASHKPGLPNCYIWLFTAWNLLSGVLYPFPFGRRNVITVQKKTGHLLEKGWVESWLELDCEIMQSQSFFKLHLQKKGMKRLKWRMCLLALCSELLPYSAPKSCVINIQAMAGNEIPLCIQYVAESHRLSCERI